MMLQSMHRAAEFRGSVPLAHDMRVNGCAVVLPTALPMRVVTVQPAWSAAMQTLPSVPARVRRWPLLPVVAAMTLLAGAAAAGGTSMKCPDPQGSSRLCSPAPKWQAMGRHVELQQDKRSYQHELVILALPPASSSASTIQEEQRQRGTRWHAAGCLRAFICCQACMRTCDWQSRMRCLLLRLLPSFHQLPRSALILIAVHRAVPNSVSIPAAVHGFAPAGQAERGKLWRGSGAL